MLKNFDDPNRATDTLLSLLTTCGTLAGIAVGLAGLVNSSPKGSAVTLADDILLLSALGFLLDCYLAFFALRNVGQPLAARLLPVIDGIFLLSLTLIVFSGFVVAFELM